MSTFKNISNQKFGKLTTINISHFNKGTYWNCNCECGNSKIVRAGHLIRGDITSCGCIRGESTTKNILGNKYGTYTVIKRIKKKKTKGNKLWGCWECLCDCGETNYLFTDEILDLNKYGCRKCYFNNFKGKNHPLWDKNIPLEERIQRRNIPELREWRRNIYERDNYTCQVTKVRCGELCAHHLESWHANKSLRFVLTNGITVLKSVHKYFHDLYGRKNNTRVQFQEFVKNLTKKEIKQLIKENERKPKRRRKQNTRRSAKSIKKK